MVWYPDPVNQTGLIGMFQYANGVTDSTFAVLLLISVYVIPLMFLILRGFEWPKSALAAGFIVTITAVLLRVAEIVTVDRYIFFGVATILIPLVYVYLKDSSN